MVETVALDFVALALNFVALALNFSAVGLLQSFKSTKPKAIEKLIYRGIIFSFKDFGF